MKRRTFLGLAMTVGVAGCSTNSGVQTPPTGEPESQEAAEHIERATDHLTTAAAEFQRASSRLGGLYDTLSYNSDAVTVALDHADEELAAASAADPSDVQRFRINYLKDYADLIRHTAGTYDGLLLVLEHLELAGSYVDADRREDAHVELDEAESDRQAAANELDSATGVLASLQDQDVGLETELNLLEYERLLDTSDSVIKTLASYIPAWGHWIDGSVEWSLGRTALEEEEYGEAIERFETAWEEFETARYEFREAEEVADTDLRHTMIEYECRARRRRDAAELAVDAATAYDAGNIVEGNDYMDDVQDTLNSSC